jgi:transposase
MSPLYGGIDLHANNSLIAVVDDQDRVVFRKRLPNQLETILQALAPYQAQLRGLAVESTYNWYWLVDGLMDAGYIVHLANPVAMTQYTGLKHTDDDSDAVWLAHLLRLQILPTGYIYPKTMRPVRDLLRKRSQLVRQQTIQLLSIQNILMRNTGRALNAKRIKQLTAEAVTDLFPIPALALAVQSS